MGHETSIPLPHQAIGELIWLLLKSLHHGGLNIFIQPDSKASETWRPHTHGHHMTKEIWAVWMMNHMCQHIDHVKSPTVQALLGWAWLCSITSFMSMPNALLITCECLQGFHTSTVHWWWFQSPSALSRQRTFDSSWTKMPRLKWYSHYSSNLGSYSWRWSIRWSVGWMTASMPMGTI